MAAGLTFKEVVGMILPGEYAFGLKHESGEITWSTGEDWKEAARGIGWDPKAIRNVSSYKKKRADAWKEDA